MREKIAELMAQAKGIVESWEKEHADEPMPRELVEKVQSLIGKADEYKIQLELQEQVSERESWIDAQPKAIAPSWRSALPEEGEADYDERSWLEIEGKKYRFPKGSERKEYVPAFEAYLRKGLDGMGPNDRKTLSGMSDPSGGYWVPVDFQATLIRRIAAMSVIRPNARVVPTSRDVAQWPRLVSSDEKYTSNVRLVWAGNRPQSGSFTQNMAGSAGLVTIPVNTALSAVPIANTMIEDAAFDVVGLLTELFAESFALGEDEAFLSGDGVRKPTGILKDAGQTNGPAAVNSGSSSALTGDGLIALRYKLQSQYLSNARWVMSNTTAGEIRKLKSSGGDYLWPILGSVGNLGAVREELLGFPIAFTDFMPSIAANAFPILFGDLRGYVIADRVGFSIQRLSELHALEDSTILLARKRVGGLLVEPWRIVVQKVAA